MATSRLGSAELGAMELSSGILAISRALARDELPGAAADQVRAPAMRMDCGQRQGPVLGMERVPSPESPDDAGYPRGFRPLEWPERRSWSGFAVGGLLNRTQEVAGSSPASSIWLCRAVSGPWGDLLEAQEIAPTWRDPQFAIPKTLAAARLSAPVAVAPREADGRVLVELHGHHPRAEPGAGRPDRTPSRRTGRQPLLRARRERASARQRPRAAATRLPFWR
jgi:hypothetical protein